MYLDQRRSAFPSFDIKEDCEICGKLFDTQTERRRLFFSLFVSLDKRRKEKQILNSPARASIDSLPPREQINAHRNLHALRAQINTRNNATAPRMMKHNQHLFSKLALRNNISRISVHMLHDSVSSPSLS